MTIADLTKIHKVLGAGLVTRDGVIIERRIVYDYDAEKLSALAVRTMNRTRKSLSVSKASIIIYTSNIVFFAKETEKGIFFVICQKDANIGLVMAKIDKII